MIIVYLRSKKENWKKKTMFFISIILLTILIPSLQSAKPTLKLTFTPDEKYYTAGRSVDITCETLNPTDNMESPQLWYVDFKTNRHTQVSRMLINTPPDDSPDIFKKNTGKRIEYLKKNSIRVKNLALEDSGQYECNCPDCDEQIGKQTKILQVIKAVEPKWHFAPALTLQEDAKTSIKCTADDFYPYVSHKIIRHHHDITGEGKSVVPDSNVFPHKFSWEATVTPKAEWHNTTLRCTITEGLSFFLLNYEKKEDISSLFYWIGNTEQHATKILEVLFIPRFLDCHERQHVDSTKEKSTINCTYAGNPQPQLTWLRQTDEKPITSDLGITVETKDEHHGKYTSIVTFDRDKLVNIPITTTTKSPNAQQDTTPQPKITGENYYQQLLNGGFIAKLTYNHEEKGSRKINIVGDANQARSKALDNSSLKTIQNLSTSIILFSILIILHMIYQH